MNPPRVSLDQWRTVQAVVDRGGYAQAAEYLHRSQSAVSYTLQQLQERLGIKLLVLEGRKAQLSEAGHALLQRSRRLVEDAAALETLAASLEAGREPEVRLIVDAAFPTPLLMDALEQFMPLSRGTLVRLQEVVLAGADDALESGDADLVVGYHVPPRFLADTLIHIEFVAVAHPDHPLSQLGRELTSGDLQREMQVVIRDSSLQQRIDSGWLGAEHRWTVSSIETAVAAISNRLGFGWLPLHRIEAPLVRGELQRLLLREGRNYSMPLYLIHAHPDGPGPATLQLAEILRAVVRQRTLTDGHAV